MSSFARFILFLLGLFLIFISVTSLFDSNLGIDKGFTSPTPFTYQVTKTPVMVLIAQATETLTVTPNPATATVGAAFTQIAQFATVSTQTSIVTQTPPRVFTPTVTATIVAVTVMPNIPPGTLRLGWHIVRFGEYLYCIGRAYGVAPEVIAEFNSLAFDAPLTIGQVLVIPDRRWVGIPPGPVCKAQFQSPYSPISYPTPTHVAGLFPDATNYVEGELKFTNFIESNEKLNNLRPQSAWLPVTPTEVPVAEVRTVYVDWPFKMHLGESNIVIMTFNPGTGQITVSTPPPPVISPPGLTGTPNPYRDTESSNPINIPDMFHDYRIFAIARLDAAGFDYSPKEDVQKEIGLGENLAWQWSIKPQEARTQEIIISLRLHYEPRANINPLPTVQPDEDIWSKSYPVKVEKTLYEILFGSQAPILPAVVGIVLSLFAAGKDASASLTWLGQKIKPAKKSSDIE